jgi:CHAT domain-containing protein
MIRFIYKYYPLFLLSFALAVVHINFISAIGCESEIDWNYNPLLKKRTSVSLKLSDIKSCSSENSLSNSYATTLLYQTFYETRNQDSSLFYATQLIKLAKNGQLGANKLAYAYWIKARALFEYPDKLQSQIYLLEAEKLSLDSILKVYIQVDKRYMSGIRSIGSNFSKLMEGIGLSALDYYSLSYLENERIQGNLTSTTNELNRILDIDDSYFKYFFFIKAFEERKSELDNNLIEKYNLQCEAIFKEVEPKDFLIKHRYYKFNSFRLSDEKKYRDALDSSIRLLKFHNLSPDTLEPIESLYNSQYLLEAYFGYARSLLYMTREGLGLDPVKKAYDIYIHIIRGQKRKSDNLFCLNRSNYDLIRDYRVLDNILVIAKYLTQKTGDPRYLMEAYSALDELKSASVRSGIRRNGWINEGGTFADLLLLDNDLSSEIHQVFSKYIQGDEEGAYFEQLESLFAERDIVEKKLEPYIEKAMRKEPQIEITKSIQTIQEEQLTDSTGIILISSGVHHHSLLILRDTILTSNLLERLPDLEAYTSFTRLLSDPTTDNQELTKQSRKLYAALFGEYEGFLPPYLSIVANGPFETYPFAALRTDSSGSARYFGQDHVLNYHYSLRTYLHDRENNRSVAKRELLALAPSFNERRQYSANRNIGGEASSFYLSPLHYNQSEVKDLSTSFPGRFLTDTEATIDNFNNLAADYGIIHLATHAVANASFGSQGGFFLEGFTEDPNDALITAGEITTYHLNADLVSLSACESGLGSVVFTEGTVGLTRSFSTAGAKSVLSTLWTVDDQSTAEIVTDFYDLLYQGSSKTVALSTAQENFRRKYAGTKRDRPYYWAAFVLVGNNAPIEWLGNDPFNWSYLAIAAIIMVVAFVYVQRKRQNYSS